MFHRTLGNRLPTEVCPSLAQGLACGDGVVYVVKEDKGGSTDSETSIFQKKENGKTKVLSK